jgi:hypothetical protein
MKRVDKLTKELVDRDEESVNNNISVPAYQ